MTNIVIIVPSKKSIVVNIIVPSKKIVIIIKINKIIQYYREVEIDALTSLPFLFFNPY